MTAAYREELIRIFSSYKENKWVTWIDRLFNNMQSEPSLKFRDGDPITCLFWITNNLSEAKQKKEYIALETFQKALMHYFIELAPIEDNIEKLFSICYYIDNTRLYQCHSQIEKVILSERLLLVDYPSTNLHLYLIKAFTNIDTISGIRKYLDQKFGKIEDPYFYYVYLNYYFTLFEFESGLTCLSKVIESERPDFLEQGLISLKESLLENKKMESVCVWYKNKLKGDGKVYLKSQSSMFREFFTHPDFSENEFFKNDIYYTTLIDMVNSGNPKEVFTREDIKDRANSIFNSISDPGVDFAYLDDYPANSQRAIQSAVYNFISKPGQTKANRQKWN